MKTFVHPDLSGPLPMAHDRTSGQGIPAGSLFGFAAAVGSTPAGT